MSDLLDSIFISNSKPHTMSNVVCNYGGKLNHLSTRCPFKTNPKGPKLNGYLKLFLQLCSSMSLKASASLESWYLDSVCSNNMIGNISYFKSLMNLMHVISHLETVERLRFVERYYQKLFPSY